MKARKRQTKGSRYSSEKEGRKGLERNGWNFWWHVSTFRRLVDGRGSNETRFSLIESKLWEKGEADSRGIFQQSHWNWIREVWRPCHLLQIYRYAALISFHLRFILYAVLLIVGIFKSWLVCDFSKEREESGDMMTGNEIEVRIFFRFFFLNSSKKDEKDFFHIFCMRSAISNFVAFFAVFRLFFFFFYLSIRDPLRFLMPHVLWQYSDKFESLKRIDSK